MRGMLSASIVIFASVALLGCGGAERPAGTSAEVPGDEGPLLVYVVNYPLQYFAERVGGDAVEVVFPAPGDVDPAYWSPDAETVAAYQRADLILLNGAGYAKWVTRAALPEESLIDTSAAFADRYVEVESSTTHSHGPEGEHEHRGVAFTTWLDLGLAAEQARAVAAALIEARPANEARFREALAGLEADLAALDERLDALAEKLAEQPLFFSHPVYQYLIRRLDLDAVSLHWEPEEPPDLRELDLKRKSHPARWMIWEGEPPETTIAALGDAGVSSLVFPPCANRPQDGDFISVMERSVGALENGPAARD
jgi:zinc transport system substrate-binding protein